MVITFTFNGKEYTGELSQVQGAGSTAVYHLMINKYYTGCLRVSAFDNRWVFDGEFADLAEGFGTFLQLIDWVKFENGNDQKALFNYLTIDSDQS